MPSMNSISTFNAGLVRTYGRYARWLQAPRNLCAHARAVVAKLKDLAPYAAIELILPGGSVLALLLWLYRRQKRVASFPTNDILSLL
jgi:hypothetical protein